MLPVVYVVVKVNLIQFPTKDNELPVEALYEDVSWVELDNKLPMTDSSVHNLKKSIGSLRKASLRLVLSRLATNAKQVRAELKQWLGDQASKLDCKVGLIEVFTGRARLSEEYEKQTGKASIRLGLQYGQDFTKLHDRRCLLLLIALCRPEHVWFSFPCKPWGPWTRLNMSKSDKTFEKIMSDRAVARRYLHNVSEAWNLQCALGGHAHIENPLASQAWAELTLDDAWEVRVDQCALGLRSPKTKAPVLKPTKIVTTDQELAAGLVTCRCDGNHQHEHLAGKYQGINLTSWAETYPVKFCKRLVQYLRNKPPKHVDPSIHVEEVLAEDDEELEQLDSGEQDSEGALQDPTALEMRRARALVHKVHVNTGHSSPEQLRRLALRCQSSEAIMRAIREFKCSICDELKNPPLYRKATIQHAENPNQIVGLDYVQVELHREDSHGKMVETKRNVLTAVDMASGFAQQIVVPPGPHGLSKAFHQVWCRPYGHPKVVFMDPDHRNISSDLQRFLIRHNIQLLHNAAERHWQLGQVEVANRILRGMAQRVWRSFPDASPEEVIETCATARNEQLRRHGFSPAQWFLGRESRHAGALSDLSEQMNPMTQSQALVDPQFADSLKLRDEAAKAFIEEHAKDTWRRAIAGRNRPMRGPYVQGQLVYMFRRQGKGMIATRHGAWIGPGKIIGMESSTDGPIPRLIWVSFNGFLYRCSPEGLRPLPEDEAAFRKLTKELAVGQLSPDLERADDQLRAKGSFGQYVDLVPHVPAESDMELEDDVRKEPHKIEHDSEGGPHKIRRRFYRSEEYWRKRAAGMPPAGALQEGPQPDVHQSIQDLPFSSEPADDAEEPQEKRRRVEINSDVEEQFYEPSNGDDAESSPYEPSLGPDPPAETAEPHESEMDASTTEQPVETPDSVMEELEKAASVPVPTNDDEDLQVTMRSINARTEQVLEVSLTVHPEDITENPLCLWNVLEECFAVTPKAKQRKVEVNFRKLSLEDKKLFEKAMQREWNSWIENKVTSICKKKGIPAERIIKSRWVLVWKKSSDPDDKSKTPKARLVLVGWQDPELGRIQTDSPTLRKETKHLILTICASCRWKIWGADIKTAFLSGDPQSRNIYFKPPSEIKEWMGLSDDDLFRLEKAAYGLAEAPRAWYLRLSREMSAAGLSVSKLDPCLWTLRKGDKLVGVCGVHVDDLIGGGTPEMDEVLNKMRKTLPFGDYRTYTIRYTGIEIRQDPSTYAIEIGQESYIDAMEPINTKQYGNASTPLPDASIMRTCAGQLAWVANATRPDQAFLASYLQGIQDKGTVAHLQMFNKAVREMKERKVCLRFPAGIPLDELRILCITDAGWGTRSNGESQGGYLLCLTVPKMFERTRAPCWVVDWQSKKASQSCQIFSGSRNPFRTKRPRRH